MKCLSLYLFVVISCSHQLAIAQNALKEKIFYNGIIFTANTSFENPPKPFTLTL